MFATPTGNQRSTQQIKPRGKPYWRSLERGLHLDYRRLRGKPRTWNVRHYLGDQRYEIKQIGIADDPSDADGVAILDIWQAQTAAREQMVKRAHAAGGKTIGPFTVADAYREYLEALKHEGKNLYEARLVGEVFVYPAFGDIGGEALTEIMLKRWLTDLVQQPPACAAAKINPGVASTSSRSPRPMPHVSTTSPLPRTAPSNFSRTCSASVHAASADVEEAAEANGISRRTLFRAKAKLKILAMKDGPMKEGQRTWRWHLPQAGETASSLLPLSPPAEKATAANNRPGRPAPEWGRGRFGQLAIAVPNGKAC